MTFKDTLLIYLYKKSERLENEREQLRLNTMYRSMDELDHMEQIISKVRADMFKEFVVDIMRIMKIKK